MRWVASVVLALALGAQADVYDSAFNMLLSDTLPGNLLPQVLTPSEDK